METTEALDIVGSLVSQLKRYSAKLPAVVPLAGVPSGMRPSPELVETFEQTVSRFRRQATGTKLGRINDVLIETLEAFESGLMLKSVQALLMAVDHLELMQREGAVTMLPGAEARLREYRHALHKILPGNKPELEGAGKWM